MLIINDFPSGLFFNFFCIHGVVILSISIGPFSANLIELSSIRSDRIVSNFSVLSVDDAIPVKDTHVTSGEKKLTTNNRTTRGYINQLLDISAEEISPKLPNQTTSRVTITDHKDAVEFFTSTILPVSLQTTEDGTSSQEISSPGSDHPTIKNAISEEIHNVSCLNPSSKGIFSKQTDARNTTLKSPFDELSDDNRILHKPLTSVENQLEKDSNASMADPTSVTANLTTFEIKLLNYTGEELKEKSFNYVNLYNQSYRPSYQISERTSDNIGRQHQDRAYLIYSSQIERPDVAVEKLTAATDTSDVQIHFGTHKNRNDSIGNVPLPLKIKNWFYELIIDEATSMEQKSNRLKDVFTEKDVITTETLGSRRNDLEESILSENDYKPNFSTELSPNKSDTAKYNNVYNISSTTLAPFQMTPSFESGVHANLINFPQNILKKENSTVNNQLNLNHVQNSGNESVPSFSYEINKLKNNSTTESSQDITNDSSQLGGNTTETKDTTLQSTQSESTTEGRILWNLCFTKRPTFNSISNLEPVEDPTSKTVIITKGSSNTKVFWNLCPTKKPISATETLQQPASTSTYSSVFLDSLPDYLTSSTTSSANVFDEELTSTATEDTDTTSTEPITEETTESTETPEDLFPVYWNVPTFQCHKYGLDFSQVSAWGLRQNYQDEFRGQEIAILYDPGEFPALLPAPGDRRVPRNGGVPQEGSLSRHLRLFEGHLDKLIPNTNFSGLAIIDFEHWRPVWRQNWGSLSPYRDFSRLIEKRRHPFWFSTMVEVEATYRFELGARVFLLDTLRAGKRLRPRASWGYYGYPFCFNYTPHNNRATCSYEVQLDNDSMFWLFSENTAYYPSLYLKNNDMYPSKRRRFIKGRLDEAMRVAQDVPVYPYIWYKYHDNDQFLSKDDMVNLLRMPKDNGCKGVVIWGASRDVNSRDKCNALLVYLEEVIGPAVKELHSEPFTRSEGPSQNGEMNSEELQETSDLEEDADEKKRNYNIRDFEV